MFLERSRPGSTGDGRVRGFADPSPAGRRGRPRCLQHPGTRHPRSPGPPTLEGKPPACTWPPRQGRSTPPPPKPGRTPGARPTRRAGHTTPLPRGSSRAPTHRRSAARSRRSPATSPTPAARRLRGSFEGLGMTEPIPCLDAPSSIRRQRHGGNPRVVKGEEIVQLVALDSEIHRAGTDESGADQGDELVVEAPPAGGESGCRNGSEVGSDVALADAAVRPRFGLGLNRSDHQHTSGRGEIDGGEGAGEEPRRL